MALTAVETELMRIWDQRGELTPALVVEAARPGDSPLHGQFEWDDAVAAELHRQEQARTMIRRVTIKVTHSNEEVTDYKVRAWVSATRAELPDAQPGQYVPVDSIDAAHRQMMLRRMTREIQGLKHRWAGFSEFWAQLDAMAEEQRGQAS